jgi:hypothetical protein
MLGAAIGIFVVAVVVLLMLVLGVTAAPFDSHGEVALGKAENSLGDRHTMTAAHLTSTWTFTRDEEIVLRIGGGDVSINGEAVMPGCYAGLAARGTVIAFRDAEDVSFASPDSDASCSALP